MARPHTPNPTAHLRDFLLALPPTGDDGFEGLLANALANLSGLTFRLAKSGSQFGRDGSSPAGPFAIAMEAKRYTDDLRLELLAGKAVVAGHVLEGKIDVWIIGATTEIGDDVLAKLTDILDDYGVSLISLDWATRPLPPLAVLLAATKEATLRWVLEHQPGTRQKWLVGALSEIAKHVSFQDQVTDLRRRIGASGAGLDALRLFNNDELCASFSNPGMSKRAFGQYITVAGEEYVQRRSVLVGQLAALAKPKPSECSVIVVLGEEGVGKTWLVAQWWYGLGLRPIMLLAAGRRSGQVVPAEPLETLARLIAQPNTDDQVLRRWRRRLERWKSPPNAAQLRFVIVLDGINERPKNAWADVINELAAEVQSLGGVLIVTCRPAFWFREVKPRLPHSMNVASLEVDGYSDAELSEVLGAAGIPLNEVSSQVREFIRNPRICALAVRLKITPAELTLDRLLLEYWRSRLEERGNLVAHNAADFEKLLRSHAQAWFRGERSFDRDHWSKYSGAAERYGLDAVVNDLTDVEEGRFMTVDSDDPNAYEFRSEVLPYVLGLLICDEIRRVSTTGGALSAYLDQALGPIEGFDRLGEVLAAAVSIACLTSNFPPQGRSTLITAWMDLQNVSDQLLEAAATASFLARPEPFLDVLERPEGHALDPSRHQLLTGIMIRFSAVSTIRDAVNLRLPVWLGIWSRSGRVLPDGNRSVERQRQREDRIGGRLEALTPEERAVFQSLTVERPEQPAIAVDGIVASVLARQHLAEHTTALFGWALAQTVAPREFENSYDALAWLIRLNPIDWVETTATTILLLSNVGPMSSEPMRSAAALLLRLLGDIQSSARADELNPHRGAVQAADRSKRFCNIDPHDPLSNEEPKIEGARNTAASLKPAALWNGLGQTVDDYNLEDLTAPLARFDPDSLLNLLRGIISTAPERTASQLRSLSLRLDELIPILGQSELDAISTAYEALCRAPVQLSAPDHEFVAAKLVHSLIPHLTADDQLDLILGLPTECPPYEFLLQGVKPLMADALERRLATALAEGEACQGLIRTLFFAAGSKNELTDPSRQVIARCFASGNDIVASLSARVALVSDDQGLDRLLVDSHKVPGGTVGHEAHYWRDRLMAVLAVRSSSPRLLAQVPLTYLGWAVSMGGREAITLLTDRLNHALKRMLAPVSSSLADDLRIFRSASSDGSEQAMWIEDVVEKERQGKRASLEEFTSALQDLEHERTIFSDRQLVLTEKAIAYIRDLPDEGARDLSNPPPSLGLREVVNSASNLVSDWLTSILNVRDLDRLRQVRNVGLSNASAYSYYDSLMAARVFRHLQDCQPVVNVLIIEGGVSVHLYHHALFSAACTPEFDSLRRDLFESAFDDAELETFTLSAESCGSSEWLDTYVDALVESAHPGSVARGLTIAGFRNVNGQTQRLLAREWGTGFVGTVVAEARRSYDEMAAAKHWLELAAKAQTGSEFWRFSTLAKGVLDRRFSVLIEQLDAGSMFATFGSCLYESWQEAAERRSKKRALTLFGLKAPSTDLLTAMKRK